MLARAFEVIALDDLEAAAARPRGRALMLTFDDGYRDQATPAARLLHARGLPATFFLTTGFLDRGGLSWWDEIAWMVRTSRAVAKEEIPHGDRKDHKEFRVLNFDRSTPTLPQ